MSRDDQLKEFTTITDQARLGEENKQRLRALYESVVSGEGSNPATIFAEDVVVYEPALTPWGGIYRGFAGQKELGAAQKSWIVRDSVEILDLYTDVPHVIS